MRKARGGPAGDRPFIGVDGEGATVNGTHIYTLLTAGTASVSNRKGLSFRECMEFLTSLPHPYIYVSYFFDYDVTMMLKGIPRRILEKLADREGRTFNDVVAPVEWDGFRFDWLPGKEFKVHRVGEQNVIINDVGSFFQTSFVKALTMWEIGTPEELDQIQAGKNQRSDFKDLSNEIEQYNSLEVSLLAKLMSKYRDVYGELEIHPAKWQGPGQIASAVMKRHSITKNKDLEVPMDVLSAFHSSYYAGRFEVSHFGRVNQTVYDWDINSAYPDAITKLPCLEHGWWEKSKLPNSDLYVSKIRWSGNPDAMWHSFPHRSDKGAISFPVRGEGWYTSWEVNKALPWDDFTINETWSYHTDCSCQPFVWVEDLYNLRRALGKNNKGMAIKTTLNSIYGKTAQSIGKPVYANPIWASLITSHTRSKMLGVISQVPNDTIMVATDGIFTTKKVDLPISKQLGEWEVSEYESMFLISPGVYLADGRLRALKTRGTNQRLVEEVLDTIIGNFDRFCDLLNRGESFKNAVRSTGTPVSYKQFIGIRLGLMRTENVIGEWIDTTKRIGFDWSSKRDVGRFEIVGGGIRTWPRAVKTLASQPYARETIAGLLEFSLNDLLFEQPEFMFEILGIE